MRSPYGVRRPKEQPKPRSREHGSDLKHVVETGLPPGISEEEAKDPGSSYQHVPKNHPRNSTESG
jgi:hypothetical protein